MEKIVIRKEEKEVLVNFNTIFYPINYVIKSIQDFSDSCWISIDSSGESLTVTLKPKLDDINLDTIGYDFYNYVLAVVKNSGAMVEIAKKR